MGTFQSLNDASQFVRSIQIEKGILIGSIEEAAYRNNFINDQQLNQLSQSLINSGYGIYLQTIINKQK
jgi:glucose-1-phosphate thymidylyltransferase